MKRFGLVFGTLVVGFALGNVVPGLVKAAPRVGDLKFENQFIKTWAATPEKPLTLRVSGGGEYQVTGVGNVEDDYITFQLKAGTVYVRSAHIISVQVPN
jgi:hypothetical protein